ncbi:UPF0182 family protein [Acidaminobacter sp. JC074]|uniref:UPF0182 family membrane protein n=1 Tax=Acidaminobacter sp. JC074 TaxID=2530199 RepID=UPI001F102927|nr:UPF0182 family protein [Acidaminobacter sp. JC074]MCH4888464.1 UPF0182 family protein [Acidaminobacter sp. JC074]
MDQRKSNQWSMVGFGGLLLIGFLFSGLKSLTDFITNYQWFKFNSYIQTFLVKVKTEVLIIVPLTLLIAIGLFVYLKQLKRQYYHAAHIFYNANADKNIHRAMIAFTSIFGFFVSLIISNSIWIKLRLFLSHEVFGIKDPIFNKDIGFYVFKLPFYEQVLASLIMIMFLLVFVTIIFFIIIMTIRHAAENKSADIHYINPQQRLAEVLRNEVTKAAVKRVAYLGLITLLLFSFRYYLKGYELMYSTRGVAYGASYTDIHVTLILYRVLSVATLISSGLFAFALLKGKTKLAIAVPVVLVSIGIIGSITALIVQQLIVEPDEINKEKEYLEYNIEHTQQAFGLEEVKKEDFLLEQTLTWEDILENDNTIKNIRINDARPLQQTYNQIQGIRLYYSFQGLDLDRYVIDGEYRQVFISARELNQENLSEQAKTWINKHLKYTHGYGIVMSPVNEVTEEGQPKLLLKNIPPVSESSLVVNRPEIYFGELPDRYVVVNTNEDEFDYPSGSDNKTTRYEGDAGLSLNGFNRLLFSIRESSMKLFVSSVVTDESKIILYRNIQDRVKKIAPFLEYDQNPYMVLNQEDGHLYWIIDAYTTSRYYPYSQLTTFKNKPVNYIRNSVKVVVDAYDGTTDFYIIDEDDPITSAYDDIFTDLFKPMEDFPTGLKAHIKYPQDFFNLQSSVYRSYHVDNPEVFYNGEDVWDIANEKYIDLDQPIESNYVMFKLPDSETEEFALIVPYTPKEKANMTSLFVARNDGDNYGKLYIYKFPKDKTIQGPMMIESRIDQDSTISPQFTLWGQEGSNVLRGNMIVVPVEDSLLYIEPIYLEANNPNSLPEMKRVIVAYNDTIVMEENLDTALRKVFDQSTFTIDIDASELSPEVKRLIQELTLLFNDTKSNMEEIESVLNQLNQILEGN